MAFIIICFFTRGLYYIAEEGYVAHKLKYSLARLLGLRIEYDSINETYLYFDASSTRDTWRDLIWKPFWGCVYCMNSFWGVLICLALGTSLTGAIIAILCATGLSFAIDQVTK